MKKKNSILVTIVLLILVITLGVYNYRNVNVEVNVIEDSNILDNKFEKWIETKDDEKGIHLYCVNNSKPYEIMVYFNKNDGKNLYVYTELNPIYENSEFHISY